MTRIVLVVTILAVLSPAVRLPAQQPDGPYWTTIPVPSGFQSLSVLGSIGMIRSTGTMTFFSSVLRTFTTVPMSASAALTVLENHAVIRDGTTITAYSPWTGTASSITASLSATLPYGLVGWPPSRSVTLVVDGSTQILAYGAFLGAWTTLTIAAPTTQIAVGEHCAVVGDGMQAHGFSSLTNTWTSIVANGPITGVWGTRGYAAFARTATSVYGFSGHRQQWTSNLSASGLPFVLGNIGFTFDWINGFLVYSAITGTFATHTPIGTWASFSQGGNSLMLMTDPSAAVTFNAPWGKLTHTSVPPGYSWTWSPNLALIDDTTMIRAISGISGIFSPPVPGSSSTWAVAPTVAWSGTAAYSPILSAWSPAQPGLPNQAPLFFQSGLAVLGAGKYDAFSSRTGTWTSLPVTGATPFLASNTTGIFHVAQGTSLSVFDVRSCRFDTIATQVPPTIASHGSTIIAHDGTTAYGFGVMNNHWEALALAAPPIEMQVDDAVGGIRTASDIHFYSSRGSLSTIADFPEGWRVQARGTSARIIQLGPPGSVVTMALGAAGAYLPVPPYGIVCIDPASFVGFVPLGTIPSSGVLDLSILIPYVPALNAVVPHVQNVIQPPTGMPYLSNAIAPVIL